MSASPFSSKLGLLFGVFLCPRNSKRHASKRALALFQDIFRINASRCPGICVFLFGRTASISDAGRHASQAGYMSGFSPLCGSELHSLIFFLDVGLCSPQHPSIFRPEFLFCVRWWTHVVPRQREVHSFSAFTLCDCLLLFVFFTNTLWALTPRSAPYNKPHRNFISSL